MRRLFSVLVCFVLIVFIFPSLVHLGVWIAQERPVSWRNANWSSAGILPEPKVGDASVYVFSARTGGLKGAFAVHTWLVLKQPGRSRYDRYDVVGWGTPVRTNAYDADGRWYSNTPRIEFEAHGQKAMQLLPHIGTALRSYRWRNRGDYRLWPGPNSNTFVASIIRAVPGFDAQLPITAVGRDFPEDGRWLKVTETGTLRATLAGYAGLVAGRIEGLELNFLGLVAGVNPSRGEIKIPSFGSYQIY